MLQSSIRSSDASCEELWVLCNEHKSQLKKTYEQKLPCDFHVSISQDSTGVVIKEDGSNNRRQ